MFRILSFCVFILFCSCGNKGPSPVVCTQEAKAGLNIIVKDSKTNALLGDSVTVTAADGSYNETLQFLPGNQPSFSGAFERTGAYIVTVKRNNYFTYTSGSLIVNKDECHVVPQTLTVLLQPK